MAGDLMVRIILFVWINIWANVACKGAKTGTTEFINKGAVLYHFDALNPRKL